MAYIIISLVLAIIFAAIVTDWSWFDSDDLIGTIVVVIVVFLFWGPINYFALPVLALWNYGPWFELLCTTFIAAIIYVVCHDDGYWRLWIPGGVLILVVVMSVITIGSSAAFHSRAYNERLAVEEVAFDNFSSDVNVIPVEKMVVANSQIARKVVEDRLEEDPGLGSRCRVGNMTMQQITGKFVIDGGKTLDFNEDIVWVAPLEHRSFWKWVTNDITPGYMLVYANDPTRTYLITEINGQKLALRYIESGCLDDDVERKIRRHGYANQYLAEFNFEIDQNGRPYWVICNFEPTIGFGARAPKGCIVLNAQTGDVNKYGMTDAPSWIDHIQPEEFVTHQWWGEDRQTAGVGSSKKEAESNYLQALKRTSSDTIVDDAVEKIEAKTYTVKNITFENGTYYIIFNEVKGKEFSGSTEFFRELKWTRPGNHVSVTYSEGSSDVIIIDTFDNLDFEF